MAKIAMVGYGHAAQSIDKGGEEYAYLVNDNVNVGDQIQVVATSRKGRKFATTASPVEMHRENSVTGQMIKSGVEGMIGQDLTQVYSGSQLGIGGFRGSKEYQLQVRAQNLQMYLQQNPQYEPSDNGATLMKQHGNPRGAALRKFLS